MPAHAPLRTWTGSVLRQNTNLITIITLLVILPVILVPASAGPDNATASPYLKTGIQNPSGIAIDNNGNVYVTNVYNHSIWKYSPDGRLLAKWGSKGSGDGQFNEPKNIAIDKENIVYVTDSFNHRVQTFSPEGQYLGQWAYLQDATTGPSWTDRCFPACRREIHLLGGLTAGDDGNLYLVDRSNNSIWKTTQDGIILASWGTLGNENGQFDSPSDIARDPAGNLFVADFANSRVQKFSSSGTFLLAFGFRGGGDGQFQTPAGIATDRNGFVYVTDTGLHQVQKFTSAGAFVIRWGTEGTADGQFVYPHDVAVDNNDIVYVTDFSNHRIQKFSANGSYLGKWVGTPPPPPVFPIRQIITATGSPAPRERHDSIGVNLTDYLHGLNQKLHWGYSDEQVDRYSQHLLANLGPEYQVKNSVIYFSNFTRFSRELRDCSLLTEEQRLALMYYNEQEMQYRIQYYEMPGFKSPETPHYSVQGRVTDPAGNPVAGATVRFVSDLSVENTSLSATAVSDSAGQYHLDVVWGNRQEVDVTKAGYAPYRKSGLSLTKEDNTVDFTLDRDPYPSPGFTVTGGIAAVLAGCACIAYSRRKYP